MLLQSLKCYTDSPWGWLDCSIQQNIAAVGGTGLFGLLLGGSLLYLSWYASPNQDLALPAALVVLLGGVLVPALPGNYTSLAWNIVLVGLAAGIFAIAKRYVLRGGATQ